MYRILQQKLNDSLYSYRVDSRTSPSSPANTKRKSKPTRLFNITNIIALLCQKHNVQITELEKLLKAKTIKANNFEEMMCDQLSRQLVGQDLHCDSYETSNYDQGTTNRNKSPLTLEQIDQFDQSESESESEDASDEDFNVDDNKSGKKNLVQTKKYHHNTPNELWIKAYRMYTKQTDESKPLDVSHQYFLKTKKVSAAVLYKRFKFAGQNCIELRRWRERMEKGIGTYADINMAVLDIFKKHREQYGHVTDRTIQAWALQVKNERFPNMKFKACNTWVDQWKRANGIVSRASITSQQQQKDDNTILQNQNNVQADTIDEEIQERDTEFI